VDRRTHTGSARAAAGVMGCSLDDRHGDGSGFEVAAELPRAVSKVIRTGRRGSFRR
jgi:hypothetical protein